MDRNSIRKNDVIANPAMAPGMLFKVLGKLDEQYVLQDEVTGEISLKDFSEIPHTPAPEPEMITGVLSECVAWPAPPSLTDRFALALVQRDSRLNTYSDIESFAKYTAPGIWSRAAALAAARPEQL